MFLYLYLFISLIYIYLYFIYAFIYLFISINKLMYIYILIYMLLLLFFGIFHRTLNRHTPPRILPRCYRRSEKKTCNQVYHDHHKYHDHGGRQESRAVKPPHVPVIHFFIPFMISLNVFFVPLNSGCALVRSV